MWKRVSILQDYLVASTQIPHSSRFADNVAVALKNLAPPLTIDIPPTQFELIDHISEGHSFAISLIQKNSLIISFGIPFAKALVEIRPGESIESRWAVVDDRDLPEYISELPVMGDLSNSILPKFFLGTENYVIGGRKIYGVEYNVLILGSVDCVSSFCSNLALMAKRNCLKQFPQVSDVFSITPGSGCGMPAGEPREELKRIMTRIMNHPNVSQILVVGLGCEQISFNSQVLENDLDYFKQHVHNFGDRVRVAILQNHQDQHSALKVILDDSLLPLLNRANSKRREPVAFSELTIGVKCGGSDRFSALTSNRLIGAVSDEVIKVGGNVIITETPEFEGVFSLMAQRAVSLQLKQWVLGLEKRFEKVAQSYPIGSSGRQLIAPGNKSGGLVNARLKSAGALVKAGTGPLVGGLEYTDTVDQYSQRGLYLLDGPSYDPISTSSLFLSGAHIVLFSTGRGTPLANALGPVIKIANRHKMGLSGHADFFAEKILDGQSVHECCVEFITVMADICSGIKKTKAQEQSDLIFESGGNPSHREFHIWKRWGDN